MVAVSTLDTDTDAVLDVEGAGELELEELSTLDTELRGLCEEDTETDELNEF